MSWVQRSALTHLTQEGRRKIAPTLELFLQVQQFLPFLPGIGDFFGGNGLSPGFFAGAAGLAPGLPAGFTNGLGFFGAAIEIFSLSSSKLGDRAPSRRTVDISSWRS